MQRKSKHIAVYRRLGLTLGEMLIVCAVFSILALIFIFSSREAMIKTRISRVLQEERMIASALDAYEAEFREIPLNGTQMEVLLRAHRYISIIPDDPFTLSDGEPIPYDFYGYMSPKHKFFIVSIGPDEVPDVQNALSEIMSKRVVMLGSPLTGGQLMFSDNEAADFINQYRYDPTNGTTSSGDIITYYGN